MRWRKPKPNIDDTSTKNSLDIEPAHDRERGNSNWLINLVRVYFFTHMTQGSRGSPKRSRWVRGYSHQPFPTSLNRWKSRLICAESHLGPPGTPLSLSTKLYGHASRTVHQRLKLRRYSAHPYHDWICGSTISCSKPVIHGRSLTDSSGLWLRDSFFSRPYIPPKPRKHTSN
jgi:hypothetical protein